MLEKWNETVRMVKKHYFFSVNSTARWFSFHWRTNFCSHCFICTHKWKVYWRNGPLILSYEVLGTHSKQCPLKERRWTVGFLDHLTCTWFFSHRCFWSVLKIVAITDGHSLRFPYSPLFPIIFQPIYQRFIVLELTILLLIFHYFSFFLFWVDDWWCEVTTKICASAQS